MFRERQASRLAVLFFRRFFTLFLLFFSLSLHNAAGTTLEASEPRPYVVRLSREAIDASLALGLKHMINSQTEAGNFTYAYDIKARRSVPGDNEVRQAGALWGLALLHQELGDRSSRNAVEKGISFFLTHTRKTPEGSQYIAYPDSTPGKTGTVALLSLALIDLLAAEPSLRDKYYPELDRYIRFLLSLMTSNGQFLAFYDTQTGKGIGDTTSPYFDGETLLALTRAAKEQGMTHLRPVVVRSAEAMYQKDVVEPLAQDIHSQTAKGFYQWGSMAYCELFTSGWDGTGVYAARTVKMADWVVRIEQVLRRRRNTAYAFEGLISVREIVRLAGNERAVAWLSKVVDLGLSRLMKLQVGGPFPNPYTGTDAERDPRALGGVLDSLEDPVLRIDVTQHQMHALILARRYIYTERS